MNHFNYYFNFFRDWFIGNRLAETNDAIKKIKFKIAFNVYFLFALISFLYVPYLLSPELSKQFYIATISIVINSGLLLLLKFRDTLKTTAYIHLVSIFSLIVFQMYYSQGNISFVTVSWLVVASIFSFFLLGRVAGFVVIVFSFMVVSFFTYLKYNNYNFPEYKLNEQTYYLGVFISLSLVFVFIYIMVDNFTKYNSQLIKSLFDTEKRLTTILENLPGSAIYIYERSFFLNKEFVKVFGYTEKDIVSIENLKEHLFPDFLTNEKSIFENYYHDKKNVSEKVFSIKTKTNEVKSVEVTFHFGHEYEIILFKDITDLRLKEKELAESNFFLKNLSSAIPHIIFLFDLEKGVNNYSNSAIYKILGYTREELSKNNIFDLVHPDDLPKIKKHISYLLTLKNDDTTELEYRLKNKQGKFLWIRSTHKIFKRDNSGIPKLAVGIAEDITDKKFAETQYKDVSERLLLATSAVNFGVWEWDLITNTFYWDDAMYNLFEATRKKYPNPVDAFQDRVHPEDYEFAWIGIEEAYKNQEKFENTFRIILPDNSIKYIRAAYKFFKDANGNPIRATGINYDITDDKRTEIIHKNNNLLLNAININSNKLFYEENFNNAIKNLLEDIGSKIAIDEIFICNYRSEENNDLAINFSWHSKLNNVTGEPVNENEIFKSCLKSKMLSKLEELKDGSIFKIDNYDTKDADLTLLEVKSVIIIPIFVVGNFWGVIVMKSSSQYKFWEQYNDSIFSNLANTVGTAIAQNQYKEYLKAEKEKAEEALKTKTDFLANFSHEVRTPLNAITGLTTLIAEKEVSDELKQKINLLKYSTENLNFLINDILDFNKVDSYNEPINKESFSLHELCKEINNYTTYWAEKKNIKIFLEIDNNIPNTIVGDKNKLKQILNNLIANSIYNTQQGYVKLSLSFCKKTKKHTEILFSVEDTRSENDSESHNASLSVSEGTNSNNDFSIKNINLPITLKIINVLGGKIYFDKPTLTSTSFNFKLVFENNLDRIVSTEKEISISNYNFSGKKFLLVEDNEINALIAAKFLTSWGAQVKEVSNGKQAIDILMNEYFDMILLDIFMPELDGYSTAKKIRAFTDSKKANIPIIVITASTSDEISKTINESGINDFIIKPFQPKELRDKITKYLP